MSQEISKRTPVVVGNWKMNLSLADANALAQALVESVSTETSVEQVVHNDDRNKPTQHTRIPPEEQTSPFLCGRRLFLSDFYPATACMHRIYQQWRW